MVHKVSKNLCLKGKAPVDVVDVVALACNPRQLPLQWRCNARGVEVLLDEQVNSLILTQQGGFQDGQHIPVQMKDKVEENVS